IGIGLVEIFADRAALVQRLAVMNHGRDHAERIDLQIFRRMMLQVRHVDDMAFIGKAFFFEAQPDAARRARTPAVMKNDHADTPYNSGMGSDAKSVAPLFGEFGNALDDL